MTSPARSPLERFIREVRAVRHFLPGVEKELRSRGADPEFPLTSLPTFNRKIWGLKRGLTVIGARTSMGKSALALQIAWDMARQGHQTLFLSLEMTVESMIERMFSNQLGVDNFALLTGNFAKYEAEWRRFGEMMDGMPIILTCGIGKTFEEINHVILPNMDPKPKVIIVDYIQAIRQARNEREMLNEYIRQFRETCVRGGIVGILCSQANRSTYDDDNKEPTLANLKGTGSLEELADTVILLHWPHFYNHSKPDNEYKIIIAKQRNGRTGEYVLNYDKNTYKFSDIATEPELPPREIERADWGADEAAEMFGGEVVND